MTLLIQEANRHIITPTPSQTFVVDPHSNVYDLKWKYWLHPRVHHAILDHPILAGHPVRHHLLRVPLCPYTPPMNLSRTRAHRRSELTHVNLFRFQNSRHRIPISSIASLGCTAIVVTVVPSSLGGDLTLIFPLVSTITFVFFKRMMPFDPFRRTVAPVV